MPDESHLDKKYFLDNEFYNCPFCNRNHIPFEVTSLSGFNWSNTKVCIVFTVKCSSCKKISLHLTSNPKLVSRRGYYNLSSDIPEIDNEIFFSQPTSFFTVDSRIPEVVRELITEADGCLKMNFLTGASACMRKAIYELCIKEGAPKELQYEDKIKFLKKKFLQVDSSHFDILTDIQQMTSDKVHEQSWDKWDSPTLRFLIETLRTVLYEIYVLPDEKKSRRSLIQQLREKALGPKKKPQEAE